MASPAVSFTACSQQLNTLNLIIYKLHGLNNVRSQPVELCDDPNTFIIDVHEHCITVNNLHLLNSIQPDFSGCGISALSKRLNEDIGEG